MIQEVFHLDHSYDSNTTYNHIVNVQNTNNHIVFCVTNSDNNKIYVDELDTDSDKYILLKEYSLPFENDEVNSTDYNYNTQTLAIITNKNSFFKYSNNAWSKVNVINNFNDPIISMRTTDNNDMEFHTLSELNTSIPNNIYYSFYYYLYLIFQ